MKICCIFTSKTCCKDHRISCKTEFNECKAAKSGRTLFFYLPQKLHIATRARKSHGLPTITLPIPCVDSQYPMSAVWCLIFEIGICFLKILTSVSGFVFPIFSWIYQDEFYQVWNGHLFSFCTVQVLLLLFWILLQPPGWTFDRLLISCVDWRRTHSWHGVPEIKRV